MIPSLQIYRGIAAVMVVLFHLRLLMRKYFEPAVYSDFWEFGRYGVQFFFVLSGFIIYYAHRRDLGDRSTIPTYLYKRATRIYPAYWVVTLMLLPFWIFIESFGEPYHKEFEALVKSLLLFPQSHEPHLGVGWTLEHEILFYLMFVPLLMSRKFLIGGLVWGAAIVWFGLAQPQVHYLVEFLLSANNLLFLFGIAICMVHQRWAPKKAWAAAAIIGGSLMYLAGGYYAYRHVPDESSFFVILYFGIASVFLVLGSNSPDIEKKYFGSRLMLYLGNASYSSYLLNYPFLSFASKVLKKLGADRFLPNVVIWLILAVSAVVAGCVFYQLVEKPMVNASKRYLMKRRSRREASEGSGE